MNIADFLDLSPNIDYKKVPKYVHFNSSDEWLVFKERYAGILAKNSSWSFDDVKMVFAKG